MLRYEYFEKKKKGRKTIFQYRNNKTEKKYFSKGFDETLIYNLEEVTGNKIQLIN